MDFRAEVLEGLERLEQTGVVIPIDKPLGWTSTDVVRKVKGMLRGLGYPKIGKKLKIGHAGTLDPLATGVLLICVGRATKRVDELQAEAKEYIAHIELGATTPSFDLEHPVDARYPWKHITREQIETVLSDFLGPGEQLPPVYSAKKIAGKRAYDYVRHKPELAAQIELKLTPVVFYETQLLDCALPAKPELSVRLLCSRGTYVRAFARDLGTRLGSGAHLQALRRTRSGIYCASQCLSIADLQRLLSPPETIPLF